MHVAAGGFSQTTGGFKTLGGDAYWESKALPPDRAGRMMAHYFDHDEWQEQMNARKRQKMPPKHKRPA